MRSVVLDEHVLIIQVEHDNQLITQIKKYYCMLAETDIKIDVSTKDKNEKERMKDMIINFVRSIHSNLIFFIIQFVFHLFSKTITSFFFFIFFSLFYRFQKLLLHNFIIQDFSRTMICNLLRHLFYRQQHHSKHIPKEIIDSYWEVEKKVEELSHLLSSASHPIIFTGAGISTSIGIPDYRSGPQTIIKTGPGLWNREQNSSPISTPPQTPIDKLVDLAQPSATHKIVSKMLQKNIVKHIISQNTDGLHLRSGVPIEKISQLHGNRNLESCIQCHRKYLRDFRTLRRDGKKYYPGQKRDHYTGRQCENCGGNLQDSIIYFGEKLPSEQLHSAYHHANLADLCLCLGSSLTVAPSSTIPALVTKKTTPGKVCIVNIQETPIDSLAFLRINYFCDQVMEMLAEKMRIQIG